MKALEFFFPIIQKLPLPNSMGGGSFFTTYFLLRLSQAPSDCSSRMNSRCSHCSRHNRRFFGYDRYGGLQGQTKTPEQHKQSSWPR